MKGCANENDQLLDVLRCTASQILVQLCPDKLDRIEFRSTGGKVENMNAWVLCQERLHFLALVDRRFILDQYDRAVDMLKQMVQSQ